MTDEPREIDDLDEDDLFDGESNEDNAVDDIIENEPITSSEKSNSRNHHLKKKQSVARHRIEDLIEEKKLSKKLDYFDDDPDFDNYKN